MAFRVIQGLIGCFASLLLYSHFDLRYSQYDVDGRPTGCEMARKIGLSLAVALIWLSEPRRYWRAAALGAAAVAAYVYHTDMLAFMALSFLFFGYCILSVGWPRQRLDDVRVPMGRAEKKIRALLWQYDNSKLHMVDGWIQQHKGRENELLRNLERQYGKGQATMRVTTPPPEPGAGNKGAPAWESPSPVAPSAASPTRAAAAAAAGSPADSPSAAAAAGVGDAGAAAAGGGLATQRQTSAVQRARDEEQMRIREEGLRRFEEVRRRRRQY